MPHPPHLFLNSQVLITDLPTPQVLVERSRLLGNIQRMQAAASSRGLHLRPHGKTHKSPLIARWQVDHGAIGICCAKLGEAEVFARAGIQDIRLPYPIHPSNAARLIALMDRSHISIVVDHLPVAERWSAVMKAAARRLSVLVKVDVGFHRCGIDPELPASVDFIRQIADLPSLRLCGLLSHAGHSYTATSPAELAEIAHREAELLGAVAGAARAAGVEVQEVSVGATPITRLSLDQPGLTELRPGNYVFYDRTQVALGSAGITDCALTVLATVVSKPTSDRLILDCGSKTLSSDGARGIPPPAGYGAVLHALEVVSVDDTFVVDRLSEEHAVVRVLSPPTRLEPGDRVRVLPNHSCVVTNLMDSVYLVDGQHVEEAIPVAARGRIT